MKWKEEYLAPPRVRAVCLASRNQKWKSSIHYYCGLQTLDTVVLQHVIPQRVLRRCSIPREEVATFCAWQ